MKHLHRDEKIKLYNAGLRQIFPGLETGGVSSFYSGEYPTSGNIKFQNLEKTLNAFFGNPRKKYFIHYTSINSLIEIIDKLNIRLYDLNNLNDPGELKYALSSLIPLADEDLYHFKKFHFCASFCTFNIDTLDDEFLMWQLYGQNGNGVGLVFELNNFYEKWEDACFGEVKYGLENPEFNQFKQYFEFHEKFNKKYQLFTNQSEFLQSCALFFKKENWKYEQESRLFVRAPYDLDTFEQQNVLEGTSWLGDHQKITVLKNGKQGGYIEYPLNFFEKKLEVGNYETDEMIANHKQSIPSLKPVQVITGYNVSEQIANELYLTLRHIAFNTLGYALPVKPSRYREDYK